MGKYIACKLFNAQNYAFICSPYIDQYYAEAILKLAKRGIKVRVISTDKQAGGFYLADYFDRHAESLGDNFDYLIFEKGDNNFIHSKMYIIDDKYAVDGSCNLTKAGLWQNVEHVNVYPFPNEVHSIKKSFEKIWRYNGGQQSTGEYRPQISEQKSEVVTDSGWHYNRRYGNERYKRRHYYEDEDDDFEEEDDEDDEIFDEPAMQDGEGKSKYSYSSDGYDSNRGHNSKVRRKYYDRGDNDEDSFLGSHFDDDEDDDDDNDFF